MSISNKYIRLRAIEESDLSKIQTWRNNESLRRYFREYRDFSFNQLESWYHNMISDDRFEFFIIESLEGESLGVAGLTYIDWVNKHADIHFYIGKDFEWIDDNYSHKAFPIILDYGFNKLNLNKLWAEIYDIDHKKLNFFKSYRFKQDAILRDHYFYDGKYINSNILSLLRHEYE